MKKDFRTIKNIILLIASALTLVAVTFSWFSTSKKVGNFAIESNVSGSTIAVRYYESTDEGNTYKALKGDLSMNQMYQGKKAYYRMDIKTFKETPVKLVMSFEGLKNNVTAQYVYFDYELVDKKTGTTISTGKDLKMSSFTSGSVFAVDVSDYQNDDQNDFYLYYRVEVKTDGAVVSGPAELGEIKLAGQQLS